MFGIVFWNDVFQQHVMTWSSSFLKWMRVNVCTRHPCRLPVKQSCQENDIAFYWVFSNLSWPELHAISDRRWCLPSNFTYSFAAPFFCSETCRSKLELKYVARFSFPFAGPPQGDQLFTKYWNKRCRICNRPWSLSVKRGIEKKF